MPVHCCRQPPSLQQPRPGLEPCQEPPSAGRAQSILQVTSSGCTEQCTPTAIVGTLLPSTHTSSQQAWVMLGPALLKVSHGGWMLAA